MGKGLLIVGLIAGTGLTIYAVTRSSEPSTEEKRTALVSLSKNDSSPQAGKPFLKMSPEEVDTCYKFMFYYQDIANAGRSKKAIPEDFKAKIAAVSAKWNIFT